ncbi:hypothetical protein DFJ58DRAFT_828990 [Suillus subalutaceus]|uniref:uncharacterized protein n=1 Tax=Suillus subalutaceus TaxID=48586 RepID=UPI001B85DC64|nr:uncharacterized protein DFJ58DRAFT_828990 [Suillus subalutaceus]KAG1826490.1 hypothetical protein DFJ58DRAFT_828990 [Suillus subalutaceus]
MHLSAALAILPDLYVVIKTGLWPTILAICHTPSLLLQPHELSHIFMSHVWKLFSNGVDGNAKATKQKLITPHAYGVVLDIGAGHGHTINYLDRSRVTKYVALEPNTHMHAEIRRTASAAGYTESTGSAPHPLLRRRTYQHDPLFPPTCRHSHTISGLITEVLFYEHCLSDRRDVGWWQAVLDAALERVFRGRWIEDVGGWVEGEGVWEMDKEMEEHLFGYRAGRFVKAG